MIAPVQQKKKSSINFSKAKTTICINLHYNSGESYMRFANLRRMITYVSKIFV